MPDLEPCPLDVFVSVRFEPDKELGKGWALYTGEGPEVQVIAAVGWEIERRLSLAGRTEDA